MDQVVRPQSLPWLFSARVAGLVGCQPRDAAGRVHPPPQKKACLRMKGTEEKVEPRRGERQTADMLSSRGPAVPKDHTSSLDDQRHG